MTKLRPLYVLLLHIFWLCGSAWLGLRADFHLPNAANQLQMISENQEQNLSILEKLEEPLLARIYKEFSRRNQDYGLMDLMKVHKKHIKRCQDAAFSLRQSTKAQILQSLENGELSQSIDSLQQFMEGLWTNHLQDIRDFHYGRSSNCEWEECPYPFLPNYRQIVPSIDSLRSLWQNAQEVAMPALLGDLELSLSRARVEFLDEMRGRFPYCALGICFDQYELFSNSKTKYIQKGEEFSTEIMIGECVPRRYLLAVIVDGDTIDTKGMDDWDKDYIYRIRPQRVGWHEYNVETLIRSPHSDEIVSVRDTFAFLVGVGYTR